MANATAFRHRTLAALLALLLFPACGCPPLKESYDSPTDTLLTWQAQLCRDNVEAEYRCMSRDFKRSMGGHANYHAGRQLMLASQPVMAALLKRANLAGAVASETVSEDGNQAVLVLQALGELVPVLFERETWLIIVWNDGTTQIARQPRALEDLLIKRGTDQWLIVERPELDPVQFRSLHSLAFESRWLIAGIGDEAHWTMTE